MVRKSLKNKDEDVMAWERTFYRIYRDDYIASPGEYGHDDQAVELAEQYIKTKDNVERISDSNNDYSTDSGEGRIYSSGDPRDMTDEELAEDTTYITVKASDGYVNLRKGPGTNNEIILQIYNGEILEYLDTTNDGKWYKVAYWYDDG